MAELVRVLASCLEGLSQTNDIHSVCLFVCLLLFFAIATVFQLYYNSDMMYEMRREGLILHL